MSVSIKFTLCLSDGTVVDKTEDDELMDFTLGDGQWLPALEARIAPLVIGEKQVWLLSPEEAFGYPDPTQIHWLDREELGEIEPNINDIIEFNLPNGEAVAARVLLVEIDRVQLDFSHPLAGQELILEVERIA
jgi:FKBP-type peptidyl-prolyl cis-trans isomerase SlpA